MPKKIQFRESIRIVRDGPHQRYLHNERERGREKEERQARVQAIGMGIAFMCSAALIIFIVVTAMNALSRALGG